MFYYHKDKMQGREALPENKNRNVKRLEDVRGTI